MKNHEFDRSKIYEKLHYQEKPIDYKSDIPWSVQQQIAATNGVHYVDRVGKLDKYPVYEIPVKPVEGNKLLLDIGCGWGRWLVAGSNKNYIPIGVDLRLEFCQTAQSVLRNLKKPGYTVVADLQNLPFIDNVFDLVWSFSVIQHTHYNRLVNCLKHINRILNCSGFTKLEFPNKDGVRNRLSNVRESAMYIDDFDNWAVRYYTINEYKEIFGNYLSNFKYENHSFFGIGVLKEDLHYVSFKNKILTSISLLLSKATIFFPALINYSDSIYIISSKKVDGLQEPNNSMIAQFIQLHKVNPLDNLNIVPLLRCPISGTSLILSADRTKLISPGARVYYPVIDGIPVLIESEAMSDNT